MQRGIKSQIKNNQKKINRSRSRSRSISPQNNKNENFKGKQLHNQRSRSKSPPNNANKGKSQNNKNIRSSNKKLNKSVSDKNIKRQRSKSQIKNKNKSNNQQLPTRAVSNKLNKQRKNSIDISKQEKINDKNPVLIKQTLQKNKNEIQVQQKDSGVIINIPKDDKIQLKPLEITDNVFDKYLEMICNDNDSNYVMNAFPQFKDLKKQNDVIEKDFVSGKISKLSGLFDNLGVQKIITPIKKVPYYYKGPAGKNLQAFKLILITKFKVNVDLGLIQYSLEGDKLTIFRIYISKIYRRMNYIAYVYLQTFKNLMKKHPGAERWSILILERNTPIHKFFKYLGFKIENITTESDKKKSIDYFQEFQMKKKDLNTVISSITSQIN